MKCPHCPFRDQVCRGEKNKKFCERADPASPDSPGFLRRLASFAGAVVLHVAAGAPAATEEQTAARLAICRACEHFDAGRCRKCGCGLEVKAGWADQECPIGMW